MEVGLSGPRRKTGFPTVPGRNPPRESRANSRVRTGKYRPGHRGEAGLE